MNKLKSNELKPFMSIVIILFTLFTLVFFKMEVRRMGYSVLKKLHVYRTHQDRHRSYVIEYAKFTSPERLKRLAQTRLTLSEARLDQIIQISGKEIALKQ